MEARGEEVAKVWSAKLRGVRLEAEKSMEEKETPPLETSGTVPIVVADRSQVTAFWMEVTEAWTSAGRAVLPTTKQALALSSRGARFMLGQIADARR